MILAVLYKGGLLMANQHMTMGELSSFLMYAFWVGISIAGTMRCVQWTVDRLTMQPLLDLMLLDGVMPGMSSFYSELMKGLGAGTRLWQLLDRKPEFSLDGQLKRTHALFRLTHTHTHIHTIDTHTWHYLSCCASPSMPYLSASSWIVNALLACDNICRMHTEKSPDGVGL